jgi:beta-galactosidase
MLHLSGMFLVCAAYLELRNKTNYNPFSMTSKLQVCIFLISFLFPSLLFGQSKMVLSINDHWRFLSRGTDFAQKNKIDDSKWTTVNIPHTWNAKDPFDDDETSRRGVSWYRKKLKLDQSFKNKRVYLNFEGVGQVADVYVNGIFAGQHKGAYTAFTLDITKLVKIEDTVTENVIAVQVSNAQNDFLPPLSIGYAYYGGIYRDVWLVATSNLHFDLSDYGSSGVFVSTPQVAKDKATVSVKANLTNNGITSQQVQLLQMLYDKQGNEVARDVVKISLAAGATAVVQSKDLKVSHPHLWSPEDPYLYQLKSQLLLNGEVIDEQINPVGFRWFSFDADKGFSLNGEKYLLKGTNRHQDFKDKGDALTAADHYRDLKLIKEMGCNFLRLAHYPQAKAVLDLADKMGLLVWEEIPLVNYINPVPEFLDNSKNMIREMVRQHYNHPSIIIWGSMNEVLLWSDRAERIQIQENSAYLEKVKDYAKQLDQLLRKEDNTRTSTMAMHISDDYAKYGLLDIAQLSGFNIYEGWYSGSVNAFKTTIDTIHLKNPKQPLLISEYGAEADNRVNTEKPQRLDFTGQYQRYYHEMYLRQMRQMPYLSGTAIWNQFDFSQPNVGGVSNHINQKGLVTWDRKPKDAYYLYKANWNKAKMVYIASRDWAQRAVAKGDSSTIEVYANIPNISLSINGKSYGSKRPDDVNKCVWKVLLAEGDNDVIAGNGDISDHFTINVRNYDTQLNGGGFEEIAVNCGAQAQYLDGAGEVWVEDRIYSKDSFGYVGGKPCTLNIKTVKKNTEDKPLYYYFLEGIKQYRFDVPNGTYELELNFMEPEKIAKNERVFNVRCNGETLLSNLNLAVDYGCAVAVKKRFIVKVDTEGSVVVDFEAIKGQSILNGIKLKKLN